MASKYSANVSTRRFPSPVSTWLTALRDLPKRRANSAWLIPEASIPSSRA